MNPIILPKNFLSKSLDDLYSEYKINKKNLIYKIDNRNIDNIFSIIENSNSEFNCINIQKNLLFFLIELCKSNDIENPLSTINGGVPNDGIEFINKKTMESLGVYHCHISNIDNSVLIWYIEFEDDISIKFEYLAPHPSDNYKDILKKIYENVNSYNIFTCEFLKDKKRLLYENIIIRFNSYLKKS